MATATAKTLTTAEQRHRDLAAQSDGLLVESWLHGHLWALELRGDDTVTVHVGTGSRPYRVAYPSSGDRMVRGELQAVDYERSRSFAKVESLFKFLREL
jgi:hypothetical protein